jgi:hypothetical protein
MPIRSMLSALFGEDPTHEWIIRPSTELRQFVCGRTHLDNGSLNTVVACLRDNCRRNRNRQGPQRIAAHDVIGGDVCAEASWCWRVSRRPICTESSTSANGFRAALSIGVTARSAQPNRRRSPNHPPRAESDPSGQVDPDRCRQQSDRRHLKPQAPCHELGLRVVASRKLQIVLTCLVSQPRVASSARRAHSVLSRGRLFNVFRLVIAYLKPQLWMKIAMSADATKATSAARRTQMAQRL